VTLVFIWVNEKFQIPKKQKKEIKREMGKIRGVSVASFYSKKKGTIQVFTFPKLSDFVENLFMDQEMLNDFGIKEGNYFVGEFQFDNKIIKYSMHIGGLISIADKNGLYKDYIYISKNKIIVKLKTER